MKCFNEDDFRNHGIPTEWSQTLHVTNLHKGTLRGMHWQDEPFPEVKMVQCLRGRVYDVIVDVRRESTTFGKWCGFELSENIPTALLVSEGLAHGYLTLEDRTELLYQIKGAYHPSAQKVLRWNDPSVGIDWPEFPSTISTRDAEALMLEELVPSK